MSMKRMDIDIVTKPLVLSLHGITGPVVNYDYAGAGVALMDTLWKEVADKALQTAGINHWVYDDAQSIFTAVVLTADPPAECVLTHRNLVLRQYAYWKHIGPYSELVNVYDAISDELEARDLRPCHPFVDIYGHWNEDESKLETEIHIGLE